MKKTKHTPGPWSVDRHGDVGRNQMRIARICRSSENSEGGPVVDMPKDANARLISAAPELLEACKRAYFNGDETGVAALLRRAIAKAEGTE